MELVSRKLDLAARSIDLLGSITNAANSSNPLMRTAWEIGQWLGREKVDRHSLEDCLQRAKGLVVANQKGRDFIDNVSKELMSKPVGPIFLQQSGSLGRLLTYDPNLSWMVSTVAVLFQFRRSENSVTVMVVNFILEACNNSTSQTDHDSASEWRSNVAARSQIEPVISKMVSSIWYNIINSGCDAISLPPELSRLCSKGHILYEYDFSVTIRILTFECKTKAILKMKYALQDILLWLLMHFEGHLVITLNSEIIYEKRSEGSERELEVQLMRSCADEGSCVDGTDEWEHVEIFQNVAGNHEPLLRETWYDGRPDHVGTRQPLYRLPPWHHNTSMLDCESNQTLIKCTAQRIMQWILQVPVLRKVNYPELMFSVSPEVDLPLSDDLQLRMADLLYQQPTMTSLNWGTITSLPMVFKKGRVELEAEENLIDLNDLSSALIVSELRTLLRHFPILKNLLGAMTQDCYCSSCQSANFKALVPTKHRLQPGCLLRAALDQTMLLIAHGIADGFGATDVSSVLTKDTSAAIEGAAQLLVDMSIGKKVSWDVWFGLAACVSLGCPYQRPKSETLVTRKSTTYCAIQYGNLAAIAPWIDLYKPLAVEGCLRMTIAKGRIAVKASSRNHDAGFQVVAEDFAIIETAETDDTRALASRKQKQVIDLGATLKPEQDTTAVTSDAILLPTKNNFYRLLTRIKTATCWRSIDCSDAMKTIIGQLPINECPHDPKSVAITPVPIFTYTFDELLARWPYEKSVSNKAKNSKRAEFVYCMSFVMDSVLKYNVALALSLQGLGFENYSDLCCLECTLKQVSEYTDPTTNSNSYPHKRDRYIVNLDRDLDLWRGFRNRALMAAEHKQ